MNRSAGWGDLALTWSKLRQKPAAPTAQLQHASLRDFFEQALSADTARRLKPAREAYHMAAQRLGSSRAVCA